MLKPEIRYARSGDLRIAFEVMGEGNPIDLVWAPSWASHLVLDWEWPSLVEWRQSLASPSSRSCPPAITLPAGDRDEAESVAFVVMAALGHRLLGDRPRDSQRRTLHPARRPGADAPSRLRSPGDRPQPSEPRLQPVQCRSAGHGRHSRPAAGFARKSKAFRNW